MTAQFPIWVIHDDVGYVLLGVKGEGMLTPADFGLQPASWGTACWWGWTATYKIDHGGDLVMQRLHILNLRRVGDDPPEWPAINGVAPEPAIKAGTLWPFEGAEEVSWQVGGVYENLNAPCLLSGGLLVGRDEVMYLHLPYRYAYQFEQVLELIFHEGTLIEVIDQSASAAEWRQQVIERRQQHVELLQEMDESGVSNEECLARFEVRFKQENAQDREKWPYFFEYEGELYWAFPHEP